jgi:FkbM family methyltransferase
MPSVRLPSNQQVRCVQRSEALSVCSEAQEYFEQSLEVRPGKVVFDVEANIRPFAIEAAQRSHHQAKIYAFELVPATFAALWANTRGLPNVRCFQSGFSDRAGRLEFTFYPAASASSTAFPERDHRALVDRAIFFLRHDPNLARHRWLLRLPRRRLRWQQDWVVWAVLRGRRVSCPVETLSGWLAWHRMERVDLLKIDAERAEVPILRGIVETDWPRIARVAVEAHDLGRDLPRVEGLLRSKGFEILNRYFSYGSAESGAATLFAARA